MTYVGAPMIYYGTEAGMWGGDDPCDRMPMVWPDMTYDPQQADPLGRPRAADVVEFDEALFNFYRAAIALRQADAGAAARLDRVRAPPTTRPSSWRSSGPTTSDTLLVGFNRGDAPYAWEIPLAEGESVAQVFTASGDVDSVRDRRASGRRRSSRCRPATAWCCELRHKE